MAQLIVRDLPDEVVRRLKERAAANDRSAEEEHRTLLRQLLLPEGLADHLLEMPDVGHDDDFARRGDLPRPTPR